MQSWQRIIERKRDKANEQQTNKKIVRFLFRSSLVRNEWNDTKNRKCMWKNLASFGFDKNNTVLCASYSMTAAAVRLQQNKTRKTRKTKRAKVLWKGVRERCIVQLYKICNILLRYIWLDWKTGTDSTAHQPTKWKAKAQTKNSGTHTKANAMIFFSCSPLFVYFVSPQLALGTEKKFKTSINTKCFRQKWKSVRK